MTREAAHAAARALLDAMAGTTEGEWEVQEDYYDGPLYLVATPDPDMAFGVSSGRRDAVTEQANAAYIARACPVRLGPVLRALMGED
jgi:hypothetical protein